ncbi:MAG: hypothetical protein ACQEXN_10680 [Actinomycetota bacterium]
MRTSVKVAAAAVVLLALAGCGGSKSSVSGLAEAPAGGDELPAHVELPPEADPDSARLLAEKDDYAFYTTRAAPSGFCVAIVHRQVDSEWVSGCSAALPRQFTPGHPSPIMLMGAGGVTAKLLVDGYDASKDLADGWEQLHPNLLVRGL